MGFTPEWGMCRGCHKMVETTTRIRGFCPHCRGIMSPFQRIVFGPLGAAIFLFGFAVLVWFRDAIETSWGLPLVFAVAFVALTSGGCLTTCAAFGNWRFFDD